MDNTRCVLATIKIIQLGMGIGCLTLRESAHMNPDLPEVHNTLFCGTFMGFTVIAVALLLGYCIRKPAPKEVDLFFGFVGGVCFFLCGTLSMHYPTIDEKLMILPPEEKAKYPFFILCSNIALACFANALLYIFEACVLYDIWYYEQRRLKRRAQQLERLAVEAFREPTHRHPSGPEEEDLGVDEDVRDGKLGRLRLHCYCLEAAWTHIRSSFSGRRAAVAEEAARASEAPSERSASPLPGPSSAPDALFVDLSSRHSFGGFDQTRIAITPPPEDDDSDSKD